MKAESRPGLRIPGVRSRLLLLLVVLSLPLLIISLLQLNYYRSSLNDKAETIANVEANAAALALSSWLNDHPAYRDQPGNLSQAETLDLVQRLGQSLTPTQDSTVMVFDAQGRPIGKTSTTGALVADPLTTDGAVRRRWSDGVLRMTSRRRVSQGGWGVVVGVPLESSIAGYSLAALAVTWALVLLSSILLGVWAVGRFTEPLRHLAAAASTLGTGKLDERAAVETDDEIGSLASDFNAIASQLEGKFRELREQNRFTEEVLDSLPLGVVVVESSLIVCKVNPTFSAFVGREPEKLRGRGLYEAAAGLAKLSDVVEDVRVTRKPFVSFGLPLELDARADEKVTNTERTRFWDVTIWPTTVSDSRRGDLILVLSDVTQRVRAEKLSTAAFAAEKTRAAQLQGVINQMNEGVVIIDRQMKYKINPAAAKIIGRLSKDFPDGASALCEE